MVLSQLYCIDCVESLVGKIKCQAVHTPDGWPWGTCHKCNRRTTVNTLDGYIETLKAEGRILLIQILICIFGMLTAAVIFFRLIGFEV